jgi:hypothetical protein
MSEAGGRYDLVYVHTDIPEGMTTREWRGRSAAERLTAGAATRADGHQQRARRTRRWPAALRMPARRRPQRSSEAHG